MGNAGTQGKRPSHASEPGSSSAESHNFSTDALTRNMLVRRKAEWAKDLGVTAVEISQKWPAYVVHECPCGLIDTQGSEAQ